MTYPKHLGELSIEQDAAILATLLDVASFVITNPLYVYDVWPYTDMTYDLGSAALGFYDVWAYKLNLSEATGDTVGTMYGGGDITSPDLYIETTQPTADLGDESELILWAAGAGGGSAVSAGIVLVGGDGSITDPFFQLSVGLKTVSFDEANGFGVQGDIFSSGGGISVNAGWPETSTLYIGDRSSNPTAVANGEVALWMDDGGGDGDAGDVMVTVRSGGTTKTTILVDFSAI